MYRCRRIIAILLSLAVMASVCILTASAETSESAPVIVLYYSRLADGTYSSTLTRRQLTDGFMYTSGTYGMQIVGFEVRPNAYNGLDHFTVNFNVGYYLSSDIYASPTIQYTTTNTRGTGTSIKNIYFSSTSGGKLPYINSLDSNTNWYPSTNSVNFTLIYTFENIQNQTNPYTTITLNTPINIYNSSNTAVWWYISNIAIMQSSGLEMDAYASEIATNTIIVPFLTSLSNTFFASYAWNQISYNPQSGELETTPSSGNFFDALLGSIQSLSADAEAQAAAQEKANEHGAGDALDNAYEHSNFWNLLHFTDFSDFGDYDDDALEDLADDSWLSWFSNMTKDDLDTVPITRGYDDDFISFYDMQMEEIEDKVGSLLGGGN